MKILVRIGVGLILVASAADTATAAAQRANAQAAAARQSKPRGVLTVPATGTFALDGQFAGTISINRFERRGNDIIQSAWWPASSAAALWPSVPQWPAKWPGRCVSAPAVCRSSTVQHRHPGS